MPSDLDPLAKMLGISNYIVMISGLFGVSIGDLLFRSLRSGEL